MLVSLLQLGLHPRLRRPTGSFALVLSKRLLSAARKPLGKSFFPGPRDSLELIASKDKFFADRTLDALRIVHEEEGAVFPGPPRFGKSLMLDAADAMCNVVPKQLPARSWGAKLRQAVAEVGASDESTLVRLMHEMGVPEDAKPWQHVVLRFDLANSYASVGESADLKFERSMCNQILVAGRVYGVDVPFDKGQPDVAGSLFKFRFAIEDNWSRIRELSPFAPEKPMFLVLVDEFDKPVRQGAELQRGDEGWKTPGALYGFFSQFKAWREAKLLFTGILPTLPRALSQLNDVTFVGKEFSNAQVLGLRAAEVERLLLEAVLAREGLLDYGVVEALEAAESSASEGATVADRVAALVEVAGAHVQRDVASADWSTFASEVADHVRVVAHQNDGYCFSPYDMDGEVAPGMFNPVDTLEYAKAIVANEQESDPSGNTSTPTPEVEGVMKREGASEVLLEALAAGRDGVDEKAKKRLQAPNSELKPEHLRSTEWTSDTILHVLYHVGILTHDVVPVATESGALEYRPYLAIPNERKRQELMSVWLNKSLRDAFESARVKLLEDKDPSPFVNAALSPQWPTSLWAQVASGAGRGEFALQHALSMAAGIMLSRRERSRWMTEVQVPQHGKGTAGHLDVVVDDMAWELKVVKWSRSQLRTLLQGALGKDALAQGLRKGVGSAPGLQPEQVAKVMAGRGPEFLEGELELLYELVRHHTKELTDDMLLQSVPVQNAVVDGLESFRKYRLDKLVEEGADNEVPRYRTDRYNLRMPWVEGGTIKRHIVLFVTPRRAVVVSDEVPMPRKEGGKLVGWDEEEGPPKWRGNLPIKWSDTNEKKIGELVSSTEGVVAE